jgi:calcium permeable stress-gated cation channel
VYDRQIEAVNTLESAECALLTTATKLHAKKVKQETKTDKKSGAANPSPGFTTDAMGGPLERFASDDPEKDVSPVDSLVPEKMRPTHRLPLRFMPFALPFVGQKVDSIHHARDDIVATNELLARGRAQINRQSSGKPLPLHSTDADSTIPNDNTALSEEYPVLNSAFITFNKQIAAHLAKTALNHRRPYRMAGRYTEVAPEDIIWGNLGLQPYEAKGRTVISYAATAGLVVIWAFPGESYFGRMRMKGY